MKVVVVSFKECWQVADGRWYSSGGFPLQAEAVCSLFERSELVVCRGAARPGGIPLPPAARVTALQPPTGRNLRRKVSVAVQLPLYLARIVARVRTADVVHAPVPGDLALLGMLVGLAFRKKLIGRYCGSWDSPTSATITNRFIRRLMSWAAGGRNVMLLAGLGKKPVAPGIHWIPSTTLTQSDLEQIKVDYHRPKSGRDELVYVGRLSGEKGVDHLLRALQLLQARDGDQAPRLSVIGDGPDREQLEQLAAELGLLDRVRFFGQVNRQELQRRLSQADLCVHAALTEAQAKSWLDAMAHGLPVVCYDAGTAKAMIGEDGERGLVVECGSPEAMAHGIVQMLASDDLPSVRRRCRAFAEAYTIEAWRDRIGSLCADSWGCGFTDGRLGRSRPAGPEPRPAGA